MRTMLPNFFSKLHSNSDLAIGAFQIGVARRRLATQLRPRRRASRLRTGRTDSGADGSTDFNRHPDAATPTYLHRNSRTD